MITIVNLFETRDRRSPQIIQGKASLEIFFVIIMSGREKVMMLEGNLYRYFRPTHELYMIFGSSMCWALAEENLQGFHGTSDEKVLVTS